MKRFFKLLIVLILIVILGLGLFFSYRFLTQKKAALLIESNVPSQVYVEGRQIGKTPFEGEFEQKEIDLKLVPESFEQALVPYETRIKLVSGVRTIVRREFGGEKGVSSGVEISFENSVENAAPIAVVTQPVGAKVYIDDRFLDVSPVRTSEFAVGQHEVKIEADGYKGLTFSIHSQKRYLLTVFADLEKLELKSEDQIDLEKTSSSPDQYVKILDTPIGFLRVRAEASTTSEQVFQAKPGLSYLLLATSEDKAWLKIEYEEGKQGWISAEYAQTVEAENTEK